MNEFRQYIKPLYGRHTEWLNGEIVSYANAFPRHDQPYRNDLWYRFVNMYFIYPDSIVTGDAAPIARLIPHLTHVKQIGCNALHILPFLSSPLVDAGFDVSDYMRVRDGLGSMNDVKELVTEAQRLGIRLFMDLIANHVSEAHQWFQRAQEGDTKYREYFIVQKTKPHYVCTFHKESAVWARYVVNGQQRDVNIAFPGLAGEIPHWRQGKDKYWYYHTYYPQQLDLNWHNPDVFLEFAKIIIFWASLGFNFRLDAIPFVGKGAYKRTDEDYQFTHQLTAALRYIAKYVNSECVFIVETYEKLPIIERYFGDANVKRADLAYNFHLCTFLWVALVEEDVKYVWNKLQEMRGVPVHAEWVNFLRNHDELSLAYLEDPLLSAVRDALMKYGEPFREGYGISGRAYSLLGRSVSRFLNAYFLLASLPGGMLIPYGDEVGKENIPLSRLPGQLRTDTRNINRGALAPEEFSSGKARRIMNKLAEVIRRREVLREYVNVSPVRLTAPAGVFAAAYRRGVSELLVYVNITKQVQRTEIDGGTFRDYRTVLRLGALKRGDRELALGPYSGIWLQK